MSRPVPVFLSICLAMGQVSPRVKFQPARPPSNDIKLENLVPVPMRDGTILYADVYRPAEEGKYPVLVSRTPYSTERYPNAYIAPVFFARRGYVFVYQDVRGRHESEGKWYPFRNEQQDGYDTIEWAARQPWSNGKVGMQGSSYLGHVQWQAAMTLPPHLVTIFPGFAPTSTYHDTITLNGAFRLSLAFGWGPVRQESRIMQNSEVHTMDGGPEGISFDKVLWHLPLIDMQRLVGRHAEFYTDWLRHPDYDDYWKPINVEEVFDKIPIPVCTFGGWFDILLQGSLRGYEGMSKKGKTTLARQGSQMIVGPWGHGASRKYGDLDFGEEAQVDILASALRWYDYWLKGIDNGVRNEPPVKLFLMGKNEWTVEQEYPLARTQYKKMFLDSDGHANSYRGGGRLSWEMPPASGKPDRYLYDPENPVPSVGGTNCCGVPTPAGPVDQRPIESRNDVLVYTSGFLDQEINVTGPVKLVFNASSDAVDTDFVAKLVDVYPDGKAYSMAEGLLRARYRESLSQPKLLEPDRIYEMTIDLIGVSNLFQKGHRIRIDLTSSHFPQFDRNPNTGAPFGMSDKVKIARQTVYHAGNHVSYMLLPVIP